MVDRGLAGLQRPFFASNGYRNLAWFLLGLALLRGLLVLASDPLLAIANNHDQIRVQGCIGAYPDRPAETPPQTSSPEAPFSRFRFISDVGSPCFLSSEALFAWAAWPAMWLEQSLRSDRTFSVRWKGGLQFILLLLIAAWSTRRLLALKRQDLAAGHAAIFALVVCDPGNLLYFNTFYGEAAAILSCYGLLVGALVGLACKDGASRASLLVVGLSAVLLATSKIQHLIVPLLILAAVAASAVAARRLPARLLVALFLGGLVGFSLQWMNRAASENEGIRSANLIDTLFTALLPSASDPSKLLARLELPSSCIEQSGESWYTPGMLQHERCPEVFKLDHHDLMLAVFRDPLMAFSALQGGLRHVRPWIPLQLGVVEGGVRAGLPWWAPSWNAVLDVPGQSVYFSMLLGLPIFAAGMVCLRRTRDQWAANAILLSLGGLPLCIFFVSVLGDGYVDLSKHAQLGTACLLAEFVVLICLLVDSAAWRGENHVNH
jgi:hypothetical protein